MFKDKEWPKNENKKIDKSKVAIIVLRDHQQAAPVLSSLYKDTVTAGFTSTRASRMRILLLNSYVVAGLRRLPTVQPIFGHLGNTSTLMYISYFFQHDIKI